MFKRSCSLLDKLPKPKVAEWLGGIDTVIFGTDGVLWQEYEPIKGSVEAFNAVKAKGRRCLMVTNDSVLTTSDLAKKAASLGFQVEEKDVLGSSGSISSYLTDRKFKKKVLVMGGNGICRDLNNAGICTMINHIEPNEESWMKFVLNLELDPDVGAVLVARDDALDTPDMIVACNYLRMPKMLFLTTSTDGYFAYGKHRIPDAGTVAAAVQVIANRSPIVLGKPNPRMVGKLLESGEISPEKTLVVGNTLKTDMTFACYCGFQSLLVADKNVVGEAQKIKEDGNEDKMRLVPDVCLTSLAPFHELLCKEKKPAKGQGEKNEQKKSD